MNKHAFTVRIDQPTNLLDCAMCQEPLLHSNHQPDRPDTDDHAALVVYLLSAVRRKDWHAVSDAANDLRCLEAARGAK